MISSISASLFRDFRSLCYKWRDSHQQEPLAELRWRLWISPGSSKSLAWVNCKQSHACGAPAIMIPADGIQGTISYFGRAKKQSMSYGQQDAVHGDLMRLTNLRLNAPGYLQHLRDLDGESLRSYKYKEILEYTWYIEPHEKATIIYLHLVTSAERPDRRTDAPLLDALIDIILTLFIKLAKGASKLAV